MSNQRVSNRQRYAQYEKYLSLALIADAALFLLFLLFSGLGIVWMKVILAILSIALASVCLVSLYLTGEIIKRRSRYLSVGFCAVIICLLVSLICRYPSPAAPKAVTAAVIGSISLL